MEIFVYESVNAWTHGWTTARLPCYKLTLCALGSGEPKMLTGMLSHIYKELNFAILTVPLQSMTCYDALVENN